MVSQRVNDIVQAAYSWQTPNATLEELRAGLDQMYPNPENAEVVEGEVGGVPGRWVSVPESGDTVVLHVHGGGFVMGSSYSHRDFAARIARAAGARVFLVDYRLVPAHFAPAALNDVIAAYRGLVTDGIDPAKIVISGDSAGGGVAFSLLVSLRDSGEKLPAAAFLCSPWVDFTNSGDSMDHRAAADPIVSREVLEQMALGYLGATGIAPTDPRVSPLFADLGGLPDVLVQAGTSEVLEDDAVRLVDGIRKAGGNAHLDLAYEMVHIYQLFADQLPEAQAAIDRIGEFVKHRVGQSARV